MNHNQSINVETANSHINWLWSIVGEWKWKSNKKRDILMASNKRRASGTLLRWDCYASQHWTAIEDTANEFQMCQYLYSLPSDGKWQKRFTRLKPENATSYSIFDCLVITPKGIPKYNNGNLFAFTRKSGRKTCLTTANKRVWFKRSAKSKWN